VAQQPLRGGKVARLDRAQERGLVLGDRIDGRSMLDEQVDGLHVVPEGGGPETVLGLRALPQEEAGHRDVLAAGDRVPERGGLPGALGEGGRVDVGARFQEQAGQAHRAVRRPGGRRQAAQEVQGSAPAIVDGTEQRGVRREQRGHRGDVQGLERAEEAGPAHAAGSRLSRRA
jgi:hypothetical protein